MTSAARAEDRLRVWFLVEGATDVRLVNGLQSGADTTVVVRPVNGRSGINRPPGPGASIISGPPGRARFALFAARCLIRQRGRVDVAVVQGYGLLAAIINLVGRLWRVPTVMLVCSPSELYYRCRQEPGGTGYRRLGDAAIVGLAWVNAWIGQRYVVLSEHLRDVVRSHRGRRLPVEVIPVYGVDTVRFAPPERSVSDLRARLGLPVDSSLVFFSSRVAPEKDPDTLLRAFKQLRDDGADAYLVHRSGGYRALQSRAGELGIGERVLAADAVHPEDELPDLYRACDVCVQASRAEGLGFSVLESMACGTAVIASAVGGLRETVIDGQTGWTYERGDVAALTSTLADALANADARQRRGVAGRALVRQRFEAGDVFARFHDTLRNARRSPFGRRRQARRCDPRG